MLLVLGPWPGLASMLELGTGADRGSSVAAAFNSLLTERILKGDEDRATRRGCGERS